MKKFIALVVAAFAIVANAEWKPTYTIRVADAETLAKGVAKIGEFTGNAMIGMMAAGMINDMPGVAAFGPGRKGATTVYPFFIENGKNEYAVLYPVTITKKDFLAKFPKAVESNGLIRVKCPLVGKTKTVNYVAFSKDERWAGVSDKPQQARLALDCVKDAEKPMDGDLAKVVCLKNGINRWAEGGEEEPSPRTKDLVAQLDGVVVGIRVSDKGLDFRGIVKPAKGSELAKVGKKPLPAKPLAFAGKDSLAVSASAENCGQQMSMAAAWKEVKDIFDKEGFKTDWLQFTQKDECSKFAVDLKKLCAYIKSLDDEKDDTKKLAARLASSFKAYEEKKEKTLFKADGPAAYSELQLLPYASKFSPAERFAFTLPEASEKTPFAVGFFSLYSIIRAVLPAIAAADPTAAEDIQPILMLLPEDVQGGVAYMAWTEKDLPRFFFRIGADEFKAVSAGFAALSMQSRKARAGAGDDESDDDPDDDLD